MASIWGHGITTSSKPLRLTRGRVVKQHTIYGAPFNAHLIEENNGQTSLYLAGQEPTLFKSVSAAMRHVEALAGAAAAAAAKG